VLCQQLMLGLPKIIRFNSIKQPRTGRPPFKTTWDDLALKRAIKMASDEGYEQIAFTTGKTQAARYDLSKQIQKLYMANLIKTA